MACWRGGAGNAQEGWSGPGPSRDPAQGVAIRGWRHWRGWKLYVAIKTFEWQFLFISLFAGSHQPSPEFRRHTIVKPRFYHGREKREISTTRLEVRFYTCTILGTERFSSGRQPVCTSTDDTESQICNRCRRVACQCVVEVFLDILRLCLLLLCELNILYNLFSVCKPTFTWPNDKNQD